MTALPCGCAFELVEDGAVQRRREFHDPGCRGVEVVPVPGPAHLTGWRRRHEGTTEPHVLVLGEIEPGDPGARDWQIEHPPSCPTFCHWVPEGTDYWGEGTDEYRGGVEHGCAIQYEIESMGLDCLGDEYGRDWQTRGAWMALGGQIYLERQGLAATLPPGRYLIDYWWHDGSGMGDYGGQGDPDSRFSLLGPETPLALTYPPNLLNPHVHFTTRPPYLLRR